MALPDDFDSDYAEMAGDIPCTLVWGSQTATGTLSPIDRNKDTEPDGVYDMREAQFCCAASQFTDSTPPAPSNVVNVTSTYHGLSSVQFNVSSITRGFAGVMLTLRRH